MARAKIAMLPTRAAFSTFVACVTAAAIAGAGVLVSGCATGAIGGEEGSVGRDGGVIGTDTGASDDAGAGDGASRDQGVDGGGSKDGSAFVPPPECLGGDVVVPDGHRIAFSNYAAEVTTEPMMDGDGTSSCRRRYVLSSNAPRRADSSGLDPSESGGLGNGQERVLEERAGEPLLRSGHAMFDALYALALDEARQASVAEIRDDAFDHGRSLECPSGGCFETGALWRYVWTRDTAYATNLALALVDPVRAANSLLFKVSSRRDVGVGVGADRAINRLRPCPEESENRRRCATSHILRAVWPVRNGTRRDCR
ncbi:MAG: hypothetical protein IPK13_27735 [Deltaproteobacteria bacterium]|nr:hypothetical protein [Deltaproteobacteria bacterium]